MGNQSSSLHVIASHRFVVLARRNTSVALQKHIKYQFVAAKTLINSFRQEFDNFVGGCVKQALDTITALFFPIHLAKGLSHE